MDFRLQGRFNLIALLLSLFLAHTTFANPPECLPTPNSDLAKLPTTIDSILCDALKINPSEIKAIVKEALNPYVRTTKRNFYFYHYGRRPYESSLGLGTSDVPIDPRPKVPNTKTGLNLAETYFRSQASKHFATLSDSDEFGPGLYTATDPTASLRYSDDPGLLLRIGVPKGINYLDLRIIHRDVPLSRENARLVNCYIRNQCQTTETKGWIDSYFKRMLEEGKFSFDPKDFIRHTESQAMLKEIYQEYSIGFLAGGWGFPIFEECKINRELQFMTDGIFVDPALSTKLELDMLAPALEKNPPPKKRKLYEEVLQYFDAFELEHSPQNINGGSLAGFWFYYKAWAPILHRLPAETDLEDFQYLRAFQKKRSQEMKSSRRKLANALFGCSDDPQFKEEAFPPGIR